MELYWSSYTHDSGLDQKVEYVSHFILVTDCDNGQRKKVAARSYQGRRGLQRCTPPVIRLDAYYALSCLHFFFFISHDYPRQSVADLVVTMSQDMIDYPFEL